jgi:hypothetical protein
MRSKDNTVVRLRNFYITLCEHGDAYGCVLFLKLVSLLFSHRPSDVSALESNIWEGTNSADNLVKKKKTTEKR